jgi:hypothetical protein
MMSALPVLVIIWAVLTGLFLALLAYNGTITRYEDNQLFLDDASGHDQKMQSSIVNRVNKVMPFLKISGVASAAMTVLIITIYTMDAWHRINQ